MFPYMLVWQLIAQIQIWLTSHPRRFLLSKLYFDIPRKGCENILSSLLLYNYCAIHQSVHTKRRNINRCPSVWRATFLCTRRHACACTLYKIPTHTETRTLARSTYTYTRCSVATSTRGDTSAGCVSSKNHSLAPREIMHSEIRRRERPVRDLSFFRTPCICTSTRETRRRWSRMNLGTSSGGRDDRYVSAA